MPSVMKLLSANSRRTSSKGSGVSSGGSPYESSREVVHEVKPEVRSPKGTSWGWRRRSTAASAEPPLVAPTYLTDPSLLHGITTRTLLERCAVALGSQEFHIEHHYRKSFQTDHLGDFISHDWASGRLSKLLALGLVYNSQVALIASAVTALVLSILQYGPDPILRPPRTEPLDANVARIAGTQHPGSWCMVISPLVFIGFFLFWQDLRTFLGCGTRSCFLDKYCIDQSNPTRKAAGVFGLAGFLRCSDRIIILWTPRYFTRLWCTYEVASWLHLQKPLTSVLFMPLAHAKNITALFLAGCFAYCVLLVVSSPTYALPVVATGFMLGLFGEAHQMRHCTEHLRAITEQLTKFAVMGSDCFCCTAGHVGLKGEQIACDRQVVYATIAEWFNDVNDDSSVTQEARLDRFDQAVRMRFAAQVLQKAGPTQLAYRYVIIAGWPYLFSMCDAISGTAELRGSHMYKPVIKCFAYPMVLMPLWYKCIMNLTCFVNARVGFPRLKILDLCVSLMTAQLHGLVSVLIFMPLERLIVSSETPLLPLCGTACFALLTTYVYSADLPEFCRTPSCCKRRSQTEPRVPKKNEEGSEADKAEKGEKADKAHNSKTVEKAEKAETEKKEGEAHKAKKVEEAGKEEPEKKEAEEEKAEKPEKAKKAEKWSAYGLDDDVFSIRSI